MEFWEGAALVIGGIWLVGRVSRNSPNHPVTSTSVALNPNQASGNTIGTQQDGSHALVWGEPLAPPPTPLPSNPSITTIAAVNQHIATPPLQSHMLYAPTPMRFNPVPTVPKPVTTTPVSTYANRVPVSGKFIPL